MKKIFLSFLLISLSSTLVFCQSVQNVSFTQDVDKVIITYDLEGTGKQKVSLEIERKNGPNIIPKSVKGDIGSDIKPGKNKKIIWYVYDDVESLDDEIQPKIYVIDISIGKKNIKASKKYTKTLKKNEKALKKNEKKINKSNKIKRESTVQFGIQYGGLLSVIVGNDNNSNRLYHIPYGFSAGLGLKAEFESWINIQLLPSYIQNGYKLKLIGQNNLKFKETHHAVRVPLQISISPNNNGFYMNIGGYFDYIVYGERATNENIYKLFEEDYFPESEMIISEEYSINQMDYGLIWGVSLENKSSSIVLGCRLSHGINNRNNQKKWSSNSYRSSWNYKMNTLEVYFQHFF